MKQLIRVIPRAKQRKIVQESGRLKVYLTAPPVEGKANQALVEALAEYYNVRTRSIKIIGGLKSRDKIVEINK